MMNIPWSPKFSSSPVAQILCSHHSGLGPTPGLGNQTLQATLWQKRKKKKKKCINNNNSIKSKI